jgi:hypothetical protein
MISGLHERRINVFQYEPSDRKLYHFTFNPLHIDPPNPPYKGGNKKSICSKHLVNWYYSPRP